MKKLKFTIAMMLTLFGVVIVAAHVGAKDSQPSRDWIADQDARTARDIETIQAGKGRPIGVGQDHWQAFWRNCQWVLVKTHQTPIEVDSPGSPGGKSRIVTTDSSKADFDAQLGPHDPACTNVSPTQEQTTAMQHEVDRRNREAQGLPPDWKPPVAIELPVTRP